MAAQSTLRIRIRHRAEGGNSQVIEEWGKCSGTGEYCAAFVHHGFIANFAAQLRRHIHKIECFADLRENAVTYNDIVRMHGCEMLGLSAIY